MLRKTCGIDQGPLGDTLFLDAAADAVNLGDEVPFSMAEMAKLRARHNVVPWLWS